MRECKEIIERKDIRDVYVYPTQCPIDCLFDYISSNIYVRTIRIEILALFLCIFVFGLIFNVLFLRKRKEKTKE
jgi:hypothetical protein